MITPEYFAELLATYKVSDIRLAAMCGRSNATVANWREGTYRIPQYMEMTIVAVAHRLDPAPSVKLLRLGPSDVSGILGVPIETARYWDVTRQFPMAARLAIAGHEWRRAQEPSLSQHDRHILTRLELSTHFRARNGYRARPVSGKVLPLLKLGTIGKYKHDGLVSEIAGALKLTDKGKNALYGKVR